MAIAESCCNGRIVSVLEGGYNLESLARSVTVHVSTLMTQSTDLDRLRASSSSSPEHRARNTASPPGHGTEASETVDVSSVRKPSQ